MNSRVSGSTRSSLTGQYQTDLVQCVGAEGGSWQTVWALLGVISTHIGVMRVEGQQQLFF